MGFLLNLFNLIPGRDPRRRPRAPLWRVLRAGGGAANPARARRRAAVVVPVSLATAAALVVGMVVSHVPQDRL